MRIKFITNYQILATATGVGSANDFVFNANSLFDPFGTAGTRQPLYYDQYSALYNKYKVHACGIKITMLNQVVATPTYSNSNYRVVLLPSTDTEAITDSWAMVQQPYAKETFTFLNTKVGRMKHYMSTRKVYGTQVKDTNYEATNGSNPTNMWYWRLIISKQDGSAIAAGDFIVEVKFIQYATMFDREIVLDA